MTLLWGYCMFDVYGILWIDGEHMAFITIGEDAERCARLFMDLESQGQYCTENGAILQSS